MPKTYGGYLIREIKRFRYIRVNSTPETQQSKSEGKFIFVNVVGFLQSVAYGDPWVQRKVSCGFSAIPPTIYVSNRPKRKRFDFDTYSLTKKLDLPNVQVMTNTHNVS